MDEKQYQELVEKIGKDAADKIKNDLAAAEKRINDLFAEFKKGSLTVEAFEKFKSEEMGQLNERLKELDKLVDAQKELGTKLDELSAQRASKTRKSFEDFVVETIAPKIKDLRGKPGQFLTFTAGEMKAAGIQSISSTIEDMSSVPGSPWLPGLGGTELEIFDVKRNPNFIITKVDLGRTNQRRLAWINETEYLGSPGEIAEGQEKPQIQHKFKVEFSEAKKAAAWFKITEELEEDAPQLATRMRRLLQEDVLRYFDDNIQAAVIAAAQPYVGGVGLNGMIASANYWDAIFAMHAQVINDNFPDVNTTGLHPFTSVVVQADKNTYGYWMPPFKERIQRTLVEANKLAVNHALVGDLTQYKVDIYKEFVIKVGWVNDDFIKNQFVVLGEMRYHRYISDARKKAIVYHDIRSVKASLDSAAS